MFKKFFLIAALLLIMTCPAHAAITVIKPPVVPFVGEGGYAGPAFWPFATAVSVAFTIVYLDATGVPFPLCGTFKCYYDYPVSKDDEAYNTIN